MHDKHVHLDIVGDMFIQNTNAMPTGLKAKLENLLAFTQQFTAASVALSGGVDSMLLSYILHKYSACNVNALHASSPAVPLSATTRLKEYAHNYKWNLQIIDAKELDNPSYQSNPVNRCYFCKSSLYQRIQDHSTGTIFSGTNVDDLADYRPGLVAASENKVRHPYVEANISKTEIYQLAAYFGLTDLQSLPAQPCLASRIETGIQVTSEDLIFIDSTERLVREIVPQVKDIRCRITHQGVVVELTELPLKNKLSILETQIAQACFNQGRVFIEVRQYKKGSAFLHEKSAHWQQIEIRQVS
ncbi:hypothetical protein [Catenovulum agarivorans]|uniref:hypothetical protein n=1 Tax=Catenovulum agarivorans TaxID=1172192 RepID=UPI0002D2CE06|nr:hypothetical protein [Catenovulum agarivorans]